MSFFDRFRVVAAGFLQFATERENESPIYDNCPTHCDAYNTPRTSFCSSCPIGFARKEFEDDARAELDDRTKANPGEGRFGFDYLLNCVIEIISGQSMPDHLQTIVTARLRGIIESERTRICRVEKWNRRNSTPPA